MSPDTAISPPIYFNRSGVIIPVEVDNSQPGELLQCPPLENKSTGDQFYAVGQNAKVQVRTFQTVPGKRFFQGRCILLHLRHVQLIIGGKTFNVPPDNVVPRERACVVFRTSI